MMILPFPEKATPIFCLLGCPSLVSSSDTRQTFTLRAGALNLGHPLMFHDGTEALLSWNSPYPCHNDLLTCLSLNSELLTDKDLISLSFVFNGRQCMWRTEPPKMASAVISITGALLTRKTLAPLSLRSEAYVLSS